MKFKFGIIGLGLIADFHAQAISSMENAEVYSCMSRSLDKSEAFARKFSCNAYTDISKMLNDPELDIVTICTPSGYHMEPALKAIEANKHIIVEKPLEISIDRCNKILDTAQKKGVRVSTIFQSRFYEASGKIKEAIDKNRFGKLVLGDAYVKWFRSQEYYKKGGWHGTQALDGGGALMNQSIHAIDLLQWFMGPVESVKAYSKTIGHKDIEVEDLSVAILKFKNGALGVIEGTTSIYPGYLKKIEISGTEGSIILEESNLNKWNFKNEKPEDNNIKNKISTSSLPAGGASDPGAIDFKPHQQQFENFIECINSGKKSVVEGNEGRKAVEIILAIYKSAEKGSEVFLN